MRRPTDDPDPGRGADRTRNRTGSGSRRRTQPRTPSGGPSRTLGLSPSAAGALAYLLTVVTGAVLYVVADDRFVRFHAAQSVLVFGLLLGVNVALSAAAVAAAFVPGVGGSLAWAIGAAAALTGPLGVVLWLGLLYVAYRGEEYAVPVVGGVARRLA